MRLLIIFLSILIGCGEIEELPKEIDPIGPKDVASPTPLPTAEPMNPICPGVQDFRDGPEGHRWKVSGENTGQPVLLIHSDYQVPFRCKILLKNGKLLDMRETGFANGNRQHQRVDRDCSEIAGKALGGFIECKDENQTCVFAMHKNPCVNKD